MLQIILMFLGFTFPNNSANMQNFKQDVPVIIQSTNHSQFDTGGEDGQVPPPKI
ncbi:hypothetical protein [Kaistella sp.]|uniref:hypothetical protein n=1 Tax=Kaistella sp. TaxID=2782235 RepID=UPI003C3498F4